MSKASTELKIYRELLDRGVLYWKRELIEEWKNKLPKERYSPLRCALDSVLMEKRCNALNRQNFIIEGETTLSA